VHHILYQKNIIGILIESYEISVSCLLVPLLFCYFKKQANKYAAIGGVAGGLIGLIVFRLWTPPAPRELLTLLLSLSGYFVGNTLPTQKKQ